MDKEKFIEWLENEIAFCDRVLKENNFSVKGRKAYIEGHKHAFEQALDYVKNH